MKKSVDYEIPPRPIFIRHESGKIAILTVEGIIYGFHYQFNNQNDFDKISDKLIEYDNEDYETAIKDFVLNYTQKEDYKPVVAKELAKQRSNDIIKRLNESIGNKTSHGDLIKIQDPNDYPEFHTIDKILNNHSSSIRKVQNKVSGTQKALKELDDKKKEEEAKAKERNELLNLLEKEVLDNYDGNYIDYAMDKSKYLILNESKNIAKQILMSFMVATKTKSLFNDIHGKADSGKSYIFKVSLEHYIPKKYVIELNSSTLPSFINKCKENPNYYDGKILYIGDLGDKETYERMKQIFNVLKIVISEGKYVDSKNEQKGKEWTPIDISIIGKVGAFYCSVFEDNNDKTKQLDSRAISSTPSLNNPNDKVLFKANKKIIGTVEEAYFTKTTKELESFKLYFKKSVKEYDKNKNIFINPFLMVFNEITKHRLSETRELDNINEIFKSYCILNKSTCFNIPKTVNNKEVIYIIPKIEEVQKFINIIYSSVGLKQYEKNLLLKLKEELDNITDETANELYKTIEENEYEEKYNNKSLLINETYKKLFLRNGLNNKAQTTLETKNEHYNKKYFFRINDVRKKFKNHKSIKDIEDLSSTMINLAYRGFLGKLENKYNRANVYFLNKEIIEDITEDYNLTNEDIEIAINYFHENLKQDPLKTNSKSLFNNKEMIKMEKNYKLTNLTKIKEYN